MPKLRGEPRWKDDVCCTLSENSQPSLSPPRLLTSQSFSNEEGGGETASIRRARTYLEESDDLRRSGKIGLWPYLLREQEPPLRKVKVTNRNVTAAQSTQPELPHEGDGTARARDVKELEVMSYLPAAPLPFNVTAVLPEHQQHGEEKDQEQNFPTLAALEAKKQLKQLRKVLSKVEKEQRVLAKARALAEASAVRESIKPVREATAIRPITDRAHCPWGCGEEVLVRQMSSHQQSECGMRYITCCMAGCKAVMQAASLPRHLAMECAVAQKQKSLAISAKAGQVTTLCDCGLMVKGVEMSHHKREDCPNTMVPCPREACHQTIRRGDITEHYATTCEIAKANAKHLRAAASRPKTLPCSLCKEGIVPLALSQHMREECVQRDLECPNKHLGCKEVLPALGMPKHVAEECWVEMERSERAERAKERRQMVVCPGCGFSMQLKEVARHMRESCPSRQVPCKNWELGCPVVCRQGDMENHLRVDRLLEDRPCLSFEGRSAYIALNEEDWTGPWTAEFWIYRPSIEEATREKIRVGLEYYWTYLTSVSRLAAAEAELGELRIKLTDVGGDAELREKVMDQIIASATTRDEAKLNVWIAFHSCQSALKSAMRGVHEIKAYWMGDAMAGISLGRSPWYSQYLLSKKEQQRETEAEAEADHDGKGLPAEDREVGPVGGETDEAAEVTHDDALPQELGQDQSQQHEEVKDADQEEHLETELGGPEGIAEEDDQLPAPLTMTVHGPESDSGTGALVEQEGQERDTSDDDSAPEPGLEENGMEPVETGGNIGLEDEGKRKDEQEGLENDSVDEESKAENVQKTKEEEAEEAVAIEAAARDAFWDKWGTLDGPHLAEGVAQLIDEELPTMKESVLELLGAEGKDTSVSTESSGLPKKKHKKKKLHMSAKAAKKEKRLKKHADQYGIRLEKKMQMAVHKQGGWGTLASSAKVLIQLEVGDEDQVGVTLLGKEEYIFAYRCPRERWVHLALTATKKGLFLFENGEEYGRLRAGKIPMPMSAIGGKERAAHCLLQEVRYWAVERTPVQLQRWMHDVVPACEDLRAYLTFEEGRGKYVTDVTEQRHQMKMQGQHLRWLSSRAVQDQDPPTPSWRERNLCKVALRRARLALKGRSHLAMVPCPRDCGEKIMKKNTRFHLAYLCKLRPETCPQPGCNQIIAHCDVEQHRYEDCLAYKQHIAKAQRGQERGRLVSCSFCGEVLQFRSTDTHQLRDCPYRVITCSKKGCGMSVIAKDMQEHHMLYCRTPDAMARRNLQAKAREHSNYARPWATDCDD
ncbi:unnamed protein product [Chrysoparadoxa australica]